MRLRRQGAPKSIPQAPITGQIGINIIERIVLDMGCLWIPRTQFDAGIDGYIELRDAATGVVSGSHIAVQSKCGPSYFKNESTDEFTFQPDQRDLDYWGRANLPVLVIISREPEEAYFFWSTDAIPIGVDRAKGVKVKKATQRFERSARAALLLRASPAGSGFFFSLPRREEKVWTNMLELVRYPREVFTAIPVSKDWKETIAQIQLAVPELRYEVVVRGDYLLSVHDLSKPAWRGIAEAGTVESHAGSDWASSRDAETRRRFVELLDRLLRDMLYGRRMRAFEEKPRRFFYFSKPKFDNERKISYTRDGRQSALSVVLGERNDSAGQQFHSIRHLAVSVRWTRIDRQWYVVLSPTWHYTVDGEKESLRHEEWLSGLRKLEKNNNLTSQVLFFGDYLGEQTGLFAKPHKWLEFGNLRSERLPCSVPDDEWLPPKDEAVADPNAEPDDAFPGADLFGTDWEDQER